MVFHETMDYISVETFALRQKVCASHAESLLERTIQCTIDDGGKVKTFSQSYEI